MGDAALIRSKRAAERMRAAVALAAATEGAGAIQHDVLEAVPDELLALIWKAAEASGVQAERSRCAGLMRSKSAELLLAAGEMTAQELRTVKAVLAWKESLILRGAG